MTIEKFDAKQAIQTPVVQASWLRDENYLQEAVRFSFFERTPMQRAFMPVLAGVAVFLWFSHWGFLPLIFTSAGQWSMSGSVVGSLLLLISSLATYRVSLNTSRRGYTFRDDVVQWQFAQDVVSYSVIAGGGGPSEGGARHSAQSQWNWYRSLSFNAHGLRLHRTATEAYVIPMESLQAQDKDHALGHIAAMARTAGLPVRNVPASHWPTTLGCMLMMALVLLVVLCYGAMHAASPQLRYGRIANIWFSGLETFWWVALLASPWVVGCHFFLTKTLAKHLPDKSKLAYGLHALCGAAWGFLVVYLMQISKAWIFDDALMGSNFTSPLPLALIVVSCSLAAQLLSVHGATVWTAWLSLQRKPVL